MIMFVGAVKKQSCLKNGNIVTLLEYRYVLT